MRTQLTRRTFLKAGGALVVLAGAPVEMLASAGKVLALGAAFPTPDPTALAAWLTINADGTVVARSSHVELGHGITTGLAQIVAEELDVPVARVEMLLGNTDVVPDQGGTFGSQTIKVAGTQWRQIAAEGRAALMQLAAAKLGSDAGKLTVKDGVVSDGAKSISYGDLVAGQALTWIAPIKYKGGANGVVGSAKPKDPSQYTIVGKPVQRVDIPDKVTAKATYVVDVKVPGMLHARVIHPKGVGSTVVSVGTLPAGSNASVVQVGNLVAVVAEREWDAIKAASQLQVTWSDWTKLPPSTGIYDTLRKLKTTDRVILDRGDANGAFAGAPQKLSATYTTPYENHAMIGPSCAIADVRPDGSVTVYSGTQYPQGLQKDVAQMLGITATQVRVLRFEGSGEYGRLSANYDDAASEAVFLSKATGKPVRVQWMRSDEHIWEPHGPGTVHDMKAGLDASGNVTAWVHEAWMPPNNDSTALGAALAGKTLRSSGVGGWTGPDIYTFPNLHEVGHGLPEIGAGDTPYGFGLRTSFLRSPGQYQITFAQEAFVDEMAALAKQDPLHFRLSHLTDPRAIAVLKAAAQKAGWEARPSPKSGASAKGGAVSGQGIALVLRDGTYAAGVVKLTVSPSTGKISVDEVTVAQDSGLVINPSAVEHQNESSVIQTISRALYEEVTFDSSNVTSTDWKSYPIATMADAPKKINFVPIDHPEISPTGVGEPSVNLMAPAISSAIFDATGVRIRVLPLRPDRVKAALSG